MLESSLVKRNSIEKQVVKPSENDGFATPQKENQSLVEKLFGPISFDDKIMGGNKIKNAPIILEAKLRLMSQFCIKVYVGNTPPSHCLMMVGHRQNNFFLAARKQYRRNSQMVGIIAENKNIQAEL
jgi:hypothetical protein